MIFFPDHLPASSQRKIAATNPIIPWFYIDFSLQYLQRYALFERVEAEQAKTYC